jgi:hypothetical protein
VATKVTISKKNLETHRGLYNDVCALQNLGIRHRYAVQTCHLEFILFQDQQLLPLLILFGKFPTQDSITAFILNSGLFFFSSLRFLTVLRSLKGGGLYLMQLIAIFINTTPNVEVAAKSNNVLFLGIGTKNKHQ